jgi:hypothetical protein
MWALTYLPPEPGGFVCHCALSVRVVLALLVARPISSCSFPCTSISCCSRYRLAHCLEAWWIQSCVITLHPQCADHAVNGFRDRVTWYPGVGQVSSRIVCCAVPPIIHCIAGCTQTHLFAVRVPLVSW